MLEDAPERVSRADLSSAARLVADGVRRGRDTRDPALPAGAGSYGAFSGGVSADFSCVGEGHRVLRRSASSPREAALCGGVRDGAGGGGGGRADLLPEGDAGGGRGAER